MLLTVSWGWLNYYSVLINKSGSKVPKPKEIYAVEEFFIQKPAQEPGDPDHAGDFVYYRRNSRRPANPGFLDVPDWAVISLG